LNTVPYTFILLANISVLKKGTKGVDVEKIWGKMTTFLGTFDPRQIRYLGDQLSTIMEAVANLAVANRQVRFLVSDHVLITDNTSLGWLLHPSEMHF
jgi:COP9 signalosome complex subunit 3